MTPTPTPGAAAELPVVYVTKIAEGRTLFVPRASLDKSGMVALTPHAPAQSQLEALREEVARLTKERDEARAGFKNFHRSLCARFGYVHDEVYWFRDQVSLEEHIAARIALRAALDKS